MENASKALIIAGGVLLGILILSLMVYLFTSFGMTSAQINEQSAERQLTQFNAQFTSYLNKDGLTIYDVITVAGYANENNKYYEGYNDYQIQVKLEPGGYTTTQSILSNKDTLINKDRNYITSTNPKLPTYTCYGEGYNSEGRIIQICFKRNS